MRVGVDARRAQGLPCLPPRPPPRPSFPPPRSMPSRAGWCAGLAPSTHLSTHVWRDWMSGTTLCPRAGQAVGLTRRANASGRWPACAVATASDHRVYPLPSHFRVSRGHVHTPRLRETSLLGHWGQSWLGSFKLEPLEEPRGAWSKENPKGCHTQDGDGHGKSGVTWRPSSHEQL